MLFLFHIYDWEVCKEFLLQPLPLYFSIHLCILPQYLLITGFFIHAEKNWQCVVWFTNPCCYLMSFITWDFFIFSVTILAVHPGGMCLHEGLVSFCLYLYLWVNQPVIVVADPYLFWFQRKKILRNECKTNPFTKVITSFINQSKLIRTGPWHSKSNPLLIENGQCIAIYAAFH